MLTQAIATKITLRYLRETIQSQCLICWVKKQLSLSKKIETVVLLTLSVCIVPPRKATGDNKVGGSPVCGPAAATRLLQFIKKFSKVNVFVPFTNARDSGLWSICTSCFSLRLYWLESKKNHKDMKSINVPQEELEQCNSRRNPPSPLWPITSFKLTKPKKPPSFTLIQICSSNIKQHLLVPLKHVQDLSNSCSGLQLCPYYTTLLPSVNLAYRNIQPFL